MAIVSGFIPRLDSVDKEIAYLAFLPEGERSGKVVRARGVHDTQCSRCCCCCCCSCRRRGLAASGCPRGDGSKLTDVRVREEAHVAGKVMPAVAIVEAELCAVLHLVGGQFVIGSKQPAAPPSLLTRRPVLVRHWSSRVPDPGPLGVVICSTNPHSVAVPVERAKGVDQVRLRVLVRYFH